MARVFQWVAVIFASAIAIVAYYEIDQRMADEDRMALEPTAIPSPTGPDAMAPTTAPPGGVPVQTAPPGAPTTAPPAPATEPPAAAPTAEPTTAPPAAPASPPAASPVPETAEPMPHTGSDAMPGGIALAVAAIALRALHRRSY